MKKLLLGGIILLTAVYSVCAGDAAAFVDLGFSSDGSTYIFAQYGKKDRTFQAWAEIFTVNVADNKFVKGEVFKTSASDVSAQESGKDAYQKLTAKNFHSLDKYKCKPVTADDILYVATDSESSDSNTIVFKDFRGTTIDKPVLYTISLVPSYKGTGINVTSSFYITIKKTDGDGNVLESRQAGSPAIWRKGVSGYKIDRIFRDRKSKGLVFVVEKTVEDRTGVSIRYMVESIKM